MSGRRTVVIGGVHGDEPSGALVLPRLEEAGFATFGPLNPWGLRESRRHLRDGRDLNRAFAHRGCAPAERVRTFLRDDPPDLLLDLHEDVEVERPYLIQFGPKSQVGKRTLARLRQRYEFHPRPAFGVLKGRKGLIHPPLWLLRGQRLTRRWSLTFWSWLEFGVPSIVVEVPGGWSLERKQAFHQEVCETARAVFKPAVAPAPAPVAVARPASLRPPQAAARPVAARVLPASAQLAFG
ncbi:MAG TPA: hypothetical protein DEA08_39120 [Planctomycetes bacterium]|nr:hypothetical protein [Planctomycetota bacterium]